MNFQHGGNVWQILEKNNIPLDKLIDFSVNINPLVVSNKIQEELKENMPLISYYPDPYCNKLKHELSESLSIEEENILVGNGAAELIYITSAGLLPEKVTIPVPTFSEYEKSVRTYSKQSKIQFYITNEKDNFKINVNELIKYLKNTKMVFICNPNNPTGNILSKDELLFLNEECKKNNVILFIDETFINFMNNENEFTMIYNTKDNPIIVLRSFTKFFAIPGLRLGYLVANKNIIEKIRNFQPVWSVNILAQIAGFEVIQDKEYIRKSKMFIEKEREFLYHQLSKIKILKVYPSYANFILLKILYNKLDTEKLQEQLIKRNILIRDCSNFCGLNNKFFRIAVRKREENMKLLSALKRLSRGRHY